MWGLIAPTGSNIIYNISFLWATEYRLTQGITTSHKEIKSIISDAEQDYVMSITLSVLATKYLNPYEQGKLGDPIYDVTGEDGIRRMMYKANGVYYVYCFIDSYYFYAYIDINNISSVNDDGLDKFKDLAIKILESISF